MSPAIKIALPILAVILATVLMFVAGSHAKSQPFLSVSPHPYLNFQANYQLLLLAISGLSLLVTYLLDKEGFARYFAFGQIAAPTQPMPLFGIKAEDGWLKTGLSLTVVISAATAIFMYFQLKNANVDWWVLPQGIAWVLLFSLTNAWSEEVIFRLGILSPLAGVLQPMSVFLISAVLFGVPHWAGMPSGLLGALMAGILGLVLAKSLFETQGLFWAWFIHFLQDVIIIGSLFLMSK
jgi:membrane protease YdiL (CAAX protease family)